MTPGERTYEGASLMVHRTKAVPSHMGARIREVSQVETARADRNKGHATRLMRIVCDEADKRGMLLLLRAKPYADSPLDADRLVMWYACFGFVPLPGEDGVMARPVGGKWKASVPLLKPIVEAVHG